MKTLKTLTTMKMMIKRVLFLFAFVLLSFSAFSQDKDFGIWYGVSTGHKLTDKLKIEVSTDVRTFNKASRIEEAFLEGGLDYKFNRYLSIAGSYRITENIEKDDSYYFRHKLFFDLTGSLPLGVFSFSGRFRFQERFKTYIEDNGDKIPDSHTRLRFKAVYNTSSFPVNPYISTEFFCPMFENSDRVIDKERFNGGLEIQIAKKHSVEVEYIFQRDYLPHMSDENIISVNYDFKF